MAKFDRFPPAVIINPQNDSTQQRFAAAREPVSQFFLCVDSELPAPSSQLSTAVPLIYGNPVIWSNEHLRDFRSLERSLSMPGETPEENTKTTARQRAEAFD